MSLKDIQRIIDQLNPEQQIAAKTISGPLLVLAGAGTGKTKVITTRIAHMIASGIRPDKIVAVTFTNKAAREMRERVGHLVGDKLASGVYLSTFHSFALQCLRTYHHVLGLQKNFAIADEGEQRALLKEALVEQNLSELFSPATAMARISHLKDQLVTPEDFDDRQKIFDRAILKNLFVTYNRRLRLYNMVDFDDLVYLATLTFQKSKEALEEIQGKHPYLMVDEFQDTSEGQLEFVRLIAQKSQNLCVVGDDDQSIYSWRGAKPDCILQFLKSFPSAMKITLEQNYRCSPNILNAANAVIAENKMRLGKTLWSKQPNHHPVHIHAAENERDEAIFVADRIEELATKVPGFSYDHCAILVRSNSQSVPIEQVFTERKLPYIIHGGTKFFDRKEVKDLFSYLKLCNNPQDLNALFRIVNLPARGIGLATLEKVKATYLAELANRPNLSVIEVLEKYESSHSGIRDFLSVWRPASQQLLAAGSTTDIAMALRTCFEATGLRKDILSTSGNMQAAQQRIELVERVFQVVERIELKTPGLPGLVDALHLDETPFEKAKDSAQKIQVMTMHASKGLEFPTVFLIGVEENVLPHERSLDVPHGEEEERRLFYVALTRAKQRLFISHCGFRSKGRSSQAREREPQPSRFLAAIPDHLVIQTETDAGSEEARRMEAAKRLFEMFR